MVLLRLIQPLRRYLQRVVLRLGEKEWVHGIPLVDWIVLDETRDGLAEVRAALELVWEHDRRRYLRMVRDVDYVIVTNTAGTAGEYWSDIRSMLLDAGVASRHPRESTAMTIVHEATHARLWQRGVGRHPDRERIEGACVKAEVMFAGKIPGTERLVEGAWKKLGSRYWERSRQDDFAANAERLGWPGWLRKLIGLRYRREG